MSVGDAVSDLAFLNRLAESLYSSCENAPKSFGLVSRDVASLGMVLIRTEEVAAPLRLKPEQQERIHAVLEACQATLGELHTLLEKYHTSAAQSRASWDSEQWHSEDVKGLRAKLKAHISMLRIITSQLEVEATLVKYLTDVRNGDGASRAIFLNAVESIDTNEWKIKGILEEAGIDPTTFHANKDFIASLLTRAVEVGFQEEQPSEEPNRPHELTEGSFVDMGDLYESSLFDPTDRTHNEDNGSTHSLAISETAPIRAETETQRKKPPTNSTRLSNAPALKKESNTVTTSMPKLSRLTRLVRSSHPKSELANFAKKGDIVGMNSFFQDTAKRQQVSEQDLGEILFNQCLEGTLDPFVCKVLLEHGADPNFQGKAKHTPLNITMWRDDEDHLIEPMISLLAENGADLNRRTGKESYTPLASMIAHDYSNRVRLLLGLGADIEADIGKGNKVLHLVARRISCSYVRMLLSYGANYDAVNDEGQTPLHIATYVGNEDVVSQLTLAGAQRSILDKKGRTPLMMLPRTRITSQHRRVWLRLVRPPGKVDTPDESGNTVLTNAVADLDVELVSFLLFEAGADPVAPNEHKQTPLNNANSILRSMKLSNMSFVKGDKDLVALHQIIDMLEYAVSSRTLQQSQPAYG